MIIVKVSRADLEAMKDGETKIFQVKDARAVESTRTCCSMMGRILNRHFSCNADYANSIVTITRNLSK